jgi:hypothetical protein
MNSQRLSPFLSPPFFDHVNAIQAFDILSASDERPQNIERVRVEAYPHPLSKGKNFGVFFNDNSLLLTIKKVGTNLGTAQKRKTQEVVIQGKNNDPSSLGARRDSRGDRGVKSLQPGLMKTAPYPSFHARFSFRGGVKEA